MKKVFLFLLSAKNGISGLVETSQLPQLSEKSGYGPDQLDQKPNFPQQNYEKCT